MLKYLELLPSLIYSAWLRLRLPYQRTRLGRSWLSLSTLLSLIVLGIVYGQLTRVADWRSYACYLSLGLLSWNLLAGSIASSCDLLHRVRTQLLNQEIKPSYYVLEQWLTQLFIFLQASLGIGLALSIAQPSILQSLITGGWLGLLNLWLGCLWLSLLITPLSVRWPDIVPLVPVVLQLSFLASPILYYSSSLGKLAWLSNLNPLFQWIRLARQAWLGTMDWSLQALVLLGQAFLVLTLLPWLDRQRWALIERL
jgi:ABC-type polysaccharide/polyol phosphate export permease